MIIYGHRNKEIEQTTGMFQCPSCREQRAFKRVKVVRYFTLFFISLFPLGTMGEFIECQVCRRKYQTDILSVGGSISGMPSNQPYDWQCFFGVIVLCPVPLIVAGLVMSLVGFGMRRKAGTAD